MADEKFEIAKPMEWLFMIDGVRKLYLNVVGPFDKEELKLVAEWFKLVERTVLRGER